MAQSKNGKGRWIWLGVLAAAALGLWLFAAEVLWHEPQATNDSESAVVQPSFVPAPAPATPAQPNNAASDATGDASRGESAVRGDGASVNGSPTDAQP